MTPYITKDLIEYLQVSFKDKLPDASCTLEHLAFLQGQQAVVKLLMHQFRVQNPLVSQHKP